MSDACLLTLLYRGYEGIPKSEAKALFSAYRNKDCRLYQSCRRTHAISHPS